MTLQARLSASDPRYYNPGRDVAHCFQSIVKTVAQRLENADHWPALDMYLKDTGVTLDELGEAAGAFCQWIAGSLDDPRESMQDAMKRAGWNEVRPEAQLAYTSVLGAAMSGVFWVGIHEATIGTETPLRAADMAMAGEEARQLMFLSWPRRKWRLLVRGCKRHFSLNES